MRRVTEGPSVCLCVGLGLLDAHQILEEFVSDEADAILRHHLERVGTPALVEPFHATLYTTKCISEELHVCCMNSTSLDCFVSCGHRRLYGKTTNKALQICCSNRTLHAPQ